MEILMLKDFLVRNNIEHEIEAKTADLVSFKVGGLAKAVIYPKNSAELLNVFNVVKNGKFVIIGNGTNCYFTDGFYDGVIIVTRYLNKTFVENETIVAESGISISKLCRLACENSLSGLEFAYGIPGSLGGAICMNASAFGGMFSKVIQSSLVLEVKSGKVIEIGNEEHCFGEKDSIFRTNNYCILKSKIKLNWSNKEKIYNVMLEFLNKRKSTQPLDKPSAGSTFVKPKEGFASYMIDKAGLKGYTVGGAQVSTKHAGFIINANNASALDVQNLIQIIKDKVLNKFKVKLQEEIIYIE